MGGICVKKKGNMFLKNQLLLLVYSQTPPSLRATSPNLGEEPSMIADVNPASKVTWLLP